MPMQFDYDEIGDMFTYFMISFGALILTPGMVQFFFMGFKKIQFKKPFDLFNTYTFSILIGK